MCLRDTAGMKNRAGDLRIGTSGWMYKDWGATFYPPDLKKGHLQFLSQEFNTVEVNSSFYHLPRDTTFEKWRDETPDNFIFAVKLSRFITHQLRLREAKEPLDRFLTNAKKLRQKLGVILIQLPPSLKFDQDTLENFLSDLKKASAKSHLEPRFALEPRHVSWFAKEELSAVRRILTREHMAIVFPHSSKIPSAKPIDANITADFLYVRFHGPSEFAASRYGASRLRPWAKRISAWLARGLDVFVYFNNDVHGHAIHDARTLIRQTRK
jgi:uncharacterized protein YecE (DUF72 family)